MDNLEINDGLESIAIVGMAGRFPGAKNLDEFWDNLRSGVESISFFTDEELAAAKIDKTLLNNPNYVKARAILSDVEMFDAEFFGFTPREAEVMDPQHRIFLECAWEALENAGYNGETFDDKIGVYAGAGINTYLLRNLMSDSGAIALNPFEIFIGNDKDFLATKVSYKLNLKGPSINVNTACSTSLVAVHLGCQSLLNYQCDLVLAGGITIQVPQKEGYLYQEGAIASPDGHCRAFDADARGTVFGSGAGILVLKRLEDALADGDSIRAVIKGSAINNDGSLKVGYTAPSVEGQAEVIAEAMAIADIEPETISYIEAHGTGTVLGDPIEVAALKEAFSTSRNNFCAIGSVKTNIGHLDAAAGVAGLIKTVLAMEGKALPPTLHFQQPNPQIDFANSPFYVSSSLQEWQANGTPRRAGVSSFGIGGTNAHVVLEEAPKQEASGDSRPWHLLMLSAKTSSAMEVATSNLVEYLEGHPEANLADVAYTLQVGRKAFNCRRVLVCQNIEEAIASKQVFTRVLKEEEREPAFAKRPGGLLAFMFSGQGSQYVNMGLELYRTEAIFREQIDLCAELLEPHLGLDLRRLLYPEGGAEVFLEKTAIAQPALFAIEYALAKLWMYWGVQPQAFIGHSIGEYVAATLAGVFSLEDALALVAKRGQLMQQLPPGAMLAVPLSESELEPLLAVAKVEIAAINAPSLCAVSGTKEAIAILQTNLAAKGVECRPLHTDRAFHSEMMEPILGAFAERVKQTTMQAPQIPYLSNVTGTWITAEEATNPDYWAKHLRQTVRFADGLQELLANPEKPSGPKSERLLLEVGPGTTLTKLAARQTHQTETVVLSSLPHPRESRSDLEVVLSTLGKLWLAGASVNWKEFYAREKRQRLPLPTYPFERRRYWIEGQNVALPRAQEELEKKPDVGDWFYVPAWKQSQLLGRAKRSLARVLIFALEEGLGSQLAAKFELMGVEAIAVKPGSEYAKSGDREYTVNPAQPEDYNALVEDLNGTNQMPDTIVHSWTLDAIDAMEKGFYSLLFLTQALQKQNITKEMLLAVLSNNMQDVTGEETIYPDRATLLGAVTVIPQEFPNISCRSIDTIAAHSSQLVEQLLKELQAESSEAIVAYRNKHRWVQTFDRVRLEPALPGMSPLKEGGVYAIAGGLGGIGLVLAEYLAKTVKAKLVLLGRSPIPPRDRWEELLLNSGDRDAEKIRKVLRLEELGAEVLAIAADITDREEMEKAIARGRQRFGKIDGVIHAAGVPGGGTIALKNREEVEKVIAAKVRGTLVLDAIFQDVPLDFFVLFSSVTSILGGIGQIDYTAANAFMDAFARDRDNFSNKVISINWDTWQEVGMAVNTAIPASIKELHAQNLQRGILPAEGMDAIGRILANPIPQVIVSASEFSQRRDWENKRWRELVQGIETVKQSSASHPRPQLSNDYVAPRDRLEETIANIWQQFLGIEAAGIFDNFFDLGGHSLLATQVMSGVREAVGVELSVQDLFEKPTVAEIAELALAARTVEGQSIEPVSREINLPLSFTQQRLWFLDRLEDNSAAYNMLLPLRLQGVLNFEAWEAGLAEIVRRHEILRTSFQMVDGELVQAISAEADFTLGAIDWRELPEAIWDERVRDFAISEAQRPFDLSQNPLLRATLLQRSPTEYVLVFVIHHIISDDWSSGIIVRELGALYDAFSRGERSPLPELSIQYADFAYWQRQHLQGKVLAEQLTYWKQQLAGAPAVLALPADKPRPQVPTSRGATITFELPLSLSESAKKLGKNEGVTLFMLLLAAFQTLLYCYSQQEDFCVGSPIANRNLKETQGIIGLFVNTLVLRANLSGNPSFRELLKRVREVAIGAYTHQDLPFEKLLEELQLERSLSHNPLFQVWFVFNNVPMPSLEMTGLTLTPLKFDSGFVRHDLRLGLWETPEGFAGSFEYKTDLFEAKTINRMVKHLEIILTKIAADVEIKLREMSEIIEEDIKQDRLLKERELEASDRQKLKKIKRKPVR